METSLNMFRTDRRDKRVSSSNTYLYLDKEYLRGKRMCENTSKQSSKPISISCVVVMEGFENSKLTQFKGL